jgi:hypothetical protein
MAARNPGDPSTTPSTTPTPTPAGATAPGGQRAPVGPPWWRRGTDSPHPPARPTAFTARELGFEPQRATRWFSPGVLAASGLKVGVTSVFGSFLDKRELQQSRPCEPDLRYAARDEMWIDYVADTGDGFEATATVAHHVAQPALHPEGAPGLLPRGDILVFGGDEVYPAASTEGYENRLAGPWRAALPWTEPRPFDPARPDDPANPTVYALPGNHDWYDGLTGFLRMFSQARWIGGWRAHQTRSYFAVKLPHRWWLWGVDIQSDALVDEPQLEFFSSVARTATPGDRLVLATAVPSWTQLERDPQAYRNLAFLERTLLRPAGIELKLTVAGDLHHYARYAHEGDDAEIGPTHKITAGGGGAFLHPTHDLPASAAIGGISSDDPDDVADYTVAARYPPPGRSRRLSLAALLLPLRNPSFVVVPGLVNVVLLWTVQFGLRSLDPSGLSLNDAAEGWGWRDIAGGMFRNSLSALILVVLAFGLWGFARTPPYAPRGIPRYMAKTVLAAVHLAAQVVTIATAALAALTLSSVLDGWGFAVLASVLVFVIGGVACSLVTGAYLAAAIGLPGVRAHANEAFAAARLTGYRSFLRLHIDLAGVLTVYAIGIDRAVPRRHWRAVPEATSSERSWIEPTRDAPRPRVVDQVTIR